MLILCEHLPKYVCTFDYQGICLKKGEIHCLPIEFNSLNFSQIHKGIQFYIITPTEVCFVIWNIYMSHDNQYK